MRIVAGLMGLQGGDPSNGNGLRSVAQSPHTRKVKVTVCFADGRRRSALAEQVRSLPFIRREWPGIGQSYDVLTGPLKHLITLPFNMIES